MQCTLSSNMRNGDGVQNHSSKTKSRFPDPPILSKAVFDNATKLWVEKTFDEDPSLTDHQLKVLYSNFRYPASARESGLQGHIIMETIMDEFGRILDYKVKKGLSLDCDKEAMVAFGYIKDLMGTPGKIGGIPMKCKFDVPISLSLR